MINNNIQIMTKKKSVAFLMLFWERKERTCYLCDLYMELFVTEYFAKIDLNFLICCS